MHTLNQSATVRSDQIGLMIGRISVGIGLIEFGIGLIELNRFDRARDRSDRAH